MNNLPPGVTSSMIPGNRPEDLEEEAFWDMLDKKLTEAWPTASPDAFTSLVEDEYVARAIAIARDLGYDKGYGDAQMDAALEEAAMHAEDDIDG